MYEQTVRPLQLLLHVQYVLGHPLYLEVSQRVVELLLHRFLLVLAQLSAAAFLAAAAAVAGVAFLLDGLLGQDVGEAEALLQHVNTHDSLTIGSY